MPPEPDDTNPPAKDDPKADDALGAAGLRALEAERQKNKDLARQIAELKPLADAAQAAADKDKTEVQRLTEANATLEKELGTTKVSAARLKVALDKGLTATQAKRLVGDNEDELASDADELLADLGAKPGAGDRPGTPPGGKPKEALQPGNGDPETPVVETDVKKLGERMFS